MAARRALETISSAAALLHELDSGTSRSCPDGEDLFALKALQQHMLFLDGAVDRYLGEQLYDSREK